MHIRSERIWNGLWIAMVVILVVVLLSSSFLKNSILPLVGLSSVCSFIVLLVVAGIVSRPHRPKLDFDEQIRQLEAECLRISTAYRATRAFQVEEIEDEGSHYFIELADGSVLYLNGQYLYDYAPIYDDPKLDQSRQFPCTEFTIRRHRDRGYVVEIVCRGHVIEPEAVAPSFTLKEFRNGLVPEDGQVIKDRTYDQLKIERLSAAPRK